MKTFNVRDLFRKVLLSCPDITQTSFPNLFANKRIENRSGNVSKITRQEFRKLMIFIARIVQARIVTTMIDVASKVPPFNFATYPVLEESFRAIENHLCEIPLKKVSSKKVTMVSMLHSEIGNDLAICKKLNKAIGDRIQLTEAKHNVQAKKIKTLESKMKERPQVDLNELVKAIDKKTKKGAKAQKN